MKLLLVLAAVVAATLFAAFGTLSPCGMLRQTERKQDGLVAVLPDAIVDAVLAAKYGSLIAAACASNDLKLAVSAKRYISGLWDDIKKEPYIKLFNDSTTAIYLWNIVQLMAAVDAKLAELANGLEGRERLIAVHGNRFILFTVFSQIDLDELKVPDISLDQRKAQCEQLALDSLHEIIPVINEKFPDAYPGNIFKNQDRQAELLTAISL
jgi:hypothetical protein